MIMNAIMNTTVILPLNNYEKNKQKQNRQKSIEQIVAIFIVFTKIEKIVAILIGLF